jgi:hypothetical protein
MKLLIATYLSVDACCVVRVLSDVEHLAGCDCCNSGLVSGFCVRGDL